MPLLPPFPALRAPSESFRFLDTSGLPERHDDTPRFGLSHVLTEAGDAVRRVWRLHGDSTATITVTSGCLHLTPVTTVTEAQGVHIQLGVECDVIIEFATSPIPMGPSSFFLAGTYLRVGDNASGLVWRLDAEISTEWAYPTIGPLSVVSPVIEGANFDFSGPGFTVDLQTAGADDVVPAHRGVHLIRLRRTLEVGGSVLAFYISHNSGLSWEQAHSEAYLDDSTETQLGVFAYASDAGGWCRVLGVKFLNPDDGWGL